MIEDKELEVGDVIYLQGTYNWLGTLTITRVTAKFAFADNRKFSRTTASGRVIPFPKETGWMRTRYLVASPEVVRGYNKWFMATELGRISLHTLSYEALQSITKIANEDLNKPLNGTNNS